MSQDRTGFIGSSDIAPLLGISKFKTPFELYLEKIGQGVPNSSIKENFFMRRKHAEQYILNVFQSTNPMVQVTNTNRRIVDSQHDFMSVEIDFEFFDQETQKEQNGEIKSIGFHASMDDWGPEYSNEIPVDYLCQTMFTLGVTGRDFTHVVAMQGFDWYREYEVHRDDEIIDQLRASALAFWDRIQKRIPPPPQSVSDFRKLKVFGKSMEADPAILNLIGDLKKAKEASKREESIKEDIIMLLGEYDTLVGASGVLATFKNQTANRLDQEKLKSEYPDIYSACIKPSETRVLRVK